MLNKIVVSLITMISFLSLNCMAAEDDASSTMPNPRPLESRAEQRPHFGILAGATDPEGSTDSQGVFGLDIGLQVSIPVGVGLEIMRTDTDELDRTTALGKVSYNFGGNAPVIKHSYVGALLGADFERSGTYVASGPNIGFDIPLKTADANFFSLGANAKYLVFSRGGSDTAATVSGAVKYWY